MTLSISTYGPEIFAQASLSNTQLPTLPTSSQYSSYFFFWPRTTCSLSTAWQQL